MVLIQEEQMLTAAIMTIAMSAVWEAITIIAAVILPISFACFLFCRHNFFDRVFKIFSIYEIFLLFNDNAPFIIYFML